MLWLKAFLTALATYSAVPVPRLRWDSRAADRALCCFPAVGLLCGGALWGWHALCAALSAGGVLFAAGAVCLPLGITGGIHMDGFMDVADAVSSHQSREKKLEIMKDPHCGAFAVIWCGVYLLLSFGLLHTLYGTGALYTVCPGYVLSRALSAYCAVTLPRARKTGMLHAYTEHANRKATAAASAAAAALAAAGMPLLALLPGLCGLTLALLTAAGYRRFALRQFGGVTGDTAGCFLQVCELAILLGAWIGGLLS